MTNTMISEVYNMDCIEGMKQYPDNHFDLAVVDPPYGISYARGKNGFGNTTKNLPKLKDVYWDSEIPTKEYFTELFRVSKNQIIWGGNYFTQYLKPTNSWIIWDKIGEMKLENPFSDCEMAWTSFNSVTKKFTFKQQGFISDSKDSRRIHPTQKPISLYEWILGKYAKDGDLILDTHLGSQSSRIAANKAGLDFVGFEIDKEYFDNGNERYNNFISQLRMF
jgi:site-specific DNA-methyltransferase (adenine-specific)